MCILHTEQDINVHVGYIVYLSLQRSSRYYDKLQNIDNVIFKETRGRKSSSELCWINECILFRMCISLFTYVATFKEAKVGYSDLCIAAEMRKVSILVMDMYLLVFIRWQNKYLEETESLCGNRSCKS